METLKELFTPAAERAKSKIFGTFIISYILWNWKITLTILFPNKVIASNIGLIDFLYLKGYLNFNDNFLFPLLSSSIFLFLMPLADRQVFKYLEAIRRKKIDDKIRIGRGHSVPGRIYYDLKLAFEEERKQIIDFELEKKELEASLAKEKNEKGILIANENDIKRRLDNFEKIQEKLSKRKDISFLTGRWTVEYTGDFSKLEEIRIDQDHNLYIKQSNSWKTNFSVRNLHIDFINQQVEFTKYRRPTDGEKKISERPFCFFNTLVIIDKDTLEGTENETTNVTYKRQLFNNE